MVQLIALVLIAGSARQSRRIPIEQLPCNPVTGIAYEHGQWLVGGIRGLFIGKPNSWRQANDQSVREMKTTTAGTWVLYGNGSLDKVEIGTDRLYSDLIRDVSKRPWVSSLAFDGSNMLLGGEGGWMERGKNGLEEHYPKELPVNPITAIAKVGSNLWLGTQNGIYEQNNAGIKRLGFGAGLPDLWITAMIPSHDGVVAGLASGGLVRVSDKVEPIDSPSKRVRSLTRWHGCLVMGSLDGSWYRKGTEWINLDNTEVTFLSPIGKELAIGTPDGVRFFRWAG